MKGAPPGPCNMHTADFVEAHRGIFLFRGGDGIKYLSQLHVLQVGASSPLPSPLHTTAVSLTVPCIAPTCRHHVLDNACYHRHSASGTCQPRLCIVQVQAVHLWRLGWQQAAERCVRTRHWYAKRVHTLFNTAVTYADTHAPCPLSSILCLLRCRRDALGGCQCLGCTALSPCRNDPLLCARQVLPLWRLWPWCTLLQ